MKAPENIERQNALNYSNAEEKCTNPFLKVRRRGRIYSSEANGL